jgi:hypothetical protein
MKNRVLMGILTKERREVPLGLVLEMWEKGCASCLIE